MVAIGQDYSYDSLKTMSQQFSNSVYTIARTTGELDKTLEDALATIEGKYVKKLACMADDCSDRQILNLDGSCKDCGDF